MNQAPLRTGLLVASVMALAAAVRVSRLSWEPPPSRRPGSPETVVRRQSTSPDSVFRLAVAAAPFRARRVPPSARYDPSRVGEAAVQLPPAPPKPVLTLRGIAWAVAPSAIIEGIPGVEGGRAVLRGDTLSGLVVRRITPTDVTVTGFDTVWTLRVREVAP